MPVSNLTIIGHRGKGPTSSFSRTIENNGFGDVPMEYTPENTLQAFETAIDEGADGIELDIFLSKDNVPMVIHDEELNRNVVGADRKGSNLGKVGDYNVDQLNDFDVGRGMRIPRLDDVFELILRKNEQYGKKIIIDIELKDSKACEAAVAIMHTYLERGIDPSTVYFLSFNHETIRHVKQLESHAQVAAAIKTGLLYGKDAVNEKFQIKDGAEYDPAGFDYLQKLHSDVGLTALDAILWDIDEKFFDFAIDCKLDVHLSTSDFRATPEASGIAYHQFLLRAADKMEAHGLHLYYKTDEPGQLIPILTAEVENVSMPLDGMEVESQYSIMHVPNVSLARLHKPETSYSESMLQGCR